MVTLMRVELHNQQGKTSDVTVVNGRAQASTERDQAFLEGLTIIEPRTLISLTPESGERFLRALPANLAGTYSWAELKEDG